MDPELKQRLVGATVIVALIVIFVPMLFDERPGNYGANIEPKGMSMPAEDDFESGNLALPQSPAEVLGESGSGEGVATDTLPKGTGEDAPTPSSPEIPAASADRDVPPAIGDTPEAIGTPIVDHDQPDSGPRADSVEPKPPRSSTKPHDASDEPVKSAVGPGTSRDAAKPAAVPRPSGTEPEAAAAKAKPLPAVGPKPEKPAAESAKPRETAPKPVSPSVERAVTPTKPAAAPSATNPTPKPPSVKPADATAASAAKPKPAATVPSKPAAKATEATPAKAASPQPLVAWVVQTGSFASEANAKAMVEKLRAAKFPAFVESVNGPGGTVYKVQVGPELERARAEQAMKKIEASVGMKGYLVPHN